MSRAARPLSSFVASAPFAALLAVVLAACSGSTEAPSDADAGARGPAPGSDPVACGKSPPPATCPGVTSPDWVLEDFQPKSGANFKEKYGPKQMRGKVLVVALVAGWCPYCQAQVGRMEALSRELRQQGKEVNIVGINGTDALSDQNELTSRTEIPLFQDQKSANGTSIDTAYQLLGGKKDDLYVYDSKGVLTAFMRNSGSLNTDLTTADGYNTVKEAILLAK